MLQNGRIKPEVALGIGGGLTPTSTHNGAHKDDEFASTLPACFADSIFVHPLAVWFVHLGHFARILPLTAPASSFLPCTSHSSALILASTHARCLTLLQNHLLWPLSQTRRPPSPATDQTPSLPLKNANGFTTARRGTSTSSSSTLIACAWQINTDLMTKSPKQTSTVELSKRQQSTTSIASSQPRLALTTTGKKRNRSFHLGGPPWFSIDVTSLPRQMNSVTSASQLLERKSRSTTRMN